jgi:hypothetical protein
MFKIYVLVLTLAMSFSQFPMVWAGGGKDKAVKVPASSVSSEPYFVGTGEKGKSIAILVPGISGFTKNDQDYLPALVQGEFVSNFTTFSGITVLDRLNLDKQYPELLSGYYADESKVGLDLGKLPATDYIMGSAIIKGATGYTIQAWVANTESKFTVASYSGTCTFFELNNLTQLYIYVHTNVY